MRVGVLAGARGMLLPLAAVVVDMAWIQTSTKDRRLWEGIIGWPEDKEEKYVGILPGSKKRNQSRRRFAFATVIWDLKLRL